MKIDRVEQFHVRMKLKSPFETSFGSVDASEKVVLAVYADGHDGVRLIGGVGRGWDIAADADVDLPFVEALLDRVERDRCIDRRRVYATGFSNGGFFASMLGCRLGTRLAAIGLVAGGMDLAACTPSRPTPVMLLYGTSDAVVRPEMVRGARDWWVRANACGGSHGAMSRCA